MQRGVQSYSLVRISSVVVISLNNRYTAGYKFISCRNTSYDKSVWDGKQQTVTLSQLQFTGWRSG